MTIGRRGRVRRIAASLLIMLGGAAMAAPLLSARSAMPDLVSPVAAAGMLSIMTYNVEGLPWPVRIGRADDLAQIGARLGRLRERGRQPHVVVLQEAFTPAAKAIAVLGGYRYIADGPSRDAAGLQPETLADHAFADRASVLAGERSGKWADSGLRIASDYPIIGIRRMPFPAYACAGFDCLANKGVLLVRLAVPGFAAPVTLIATHLNSRHAAHVDFARSLYAYQRQIDALDAFVAANLDRASPLVVAGDFNAGQRRDRRGYLVRNAARWPTPEPVRTALDQCLRQDARCDLSSPADLRRSYRHGRDWQFFAGGTAARLEVAALAAPFGQGPDGSMLSDHIGYTAYYRVMK